jgi:hypothetical protein
MSQKESDWKTFCKMVPNLRERYLETINKKIIAILAEEQKTSTERFWSAREEINKDAKILRFCFDGHSRSKMEGFLFAMYNHGILEKGDLDQLSEEIRSKLMANSSY